MRIPKRLKPLMDDGIIDAVVRPLLSGKEAQVYLVERDERLLAAKVYKDRAERSFKNKSSYTEERKVRNSRDQRAMSKRSSKYGKKRDEAIWNSAEADTIFALHKAGVRVPVPHGFFDGVLVMECVMDDGGTPAPRIADCTFTRAQAMEVFDDIIQQVVLMLCADVVHADLSVYNILFDGQRPVIIDFPQSILASRNRNARQILLRDVANITAYFKLGRPWSALRYGYEMWDLYERGELTPQTKLTGRFDLPEHEINAERLLEELLQMEEDAVLDDDQDADFF